MVLVYRGGSKAAAAVQGCGGAMHMLLGKPAF